MGILRNLLPVMHPTGSLWLNLGDTWLGKRNAGHAPVQDGWYDGASFGVRGMIDLPAEWGAKPKDLAGIPFRVVFALQKLGWYFRSFLPWIRTNPYRAGAGLSRPGGGGVEYLFMLTPSPKTYYDVDASLVGNRVRRDSDWFMDSIRGLIVDATGSPLGLVLPSRTVGDELHQATFPEELVEPCIRLGTSERGACPTCLTGWKREKRQVDQALFETTGWSQGCKCDPLPAVPCVVLDPFSGSGTTPLVATRLGRDAIYMDQSPTYTEAAKLKFP
jgi:site-specific DNA-methyltransferase (cytosine-N4-specific)